MTRRGESCRSTVLLSLSQKGNPPQPGVNLYSVLQSTFQVLGSVETTTTTNRSGYRYKPNKHTLPACFNTHAAEIGRQSETTTSGRQPQLPHPTRMAKEGQTQDNGVVCERLLPGPHQMLTGEEMKQIRPRPSSLPPASAVGMKAGTPSSSPYRYACSSPRARRSGAAG